MDRIHWRVFLGIYLFGGLVLHCYSVYIFVGGNIGMRWWIGGYSGNRWIFVGGF